jgi:transcriptional regulator with XRE-family HTH domain
MSQLDLASEAEISAKHLSFLETGRSLPSRDMLLHLAEQLAVPLRERNLLLTAAGYAPVFPQRSLDDPALSAARRAITVVLAGHEPYPALAIDRHWTLLASNAAVTPLLAGVTNALREPPINVLRLSLHPDGLAPRIANLPAWRAHLFARLRHQIDLTADPLLIDLLHELGTYPVGGTRSSTPYSDRAYADIAVPFQLRTNDSQLTFLSTTMLFGTPIDVTLSELAIEAFFPANAETAQMMRQIVDGHDATGSREASVGNRVE